MYFSLAVWTLCVKAWKPLGNIILIVGLKTCVKPKWLKSLLHSWLTLYFFSVSLQIDCIYWFFDLEDMNVFQDGSSYRHCCRTPKGLDLARALTCTITMIWMDWRANKYKYSRHTWTVHAGNSSSPTASFTTVRCCVDSV